MAGSDQVYAKSTYDLNIWPVRGGARYTPVRDADLDGDRGGDGVDAVLMSNAFGLAMGDPGFETRFDLEPDGMINEQDMEKQAEHFGRIDCPCI